MYVTYGHNSYQHTGKLEEEFVGLSSKWLFFLVDRVQYCPESSEKQERMVLIHVLHLNKFQLSQNVKGKKKRGKKITSSYFIIMDLTFVLFLNIYRFFSAAEFDQPLKGTRC